MTTPAVLPAPVLDLPSPQATVPAVLPAVKSHKGVWLALGIAAAAVVVLVILAKRRQPLAAVPAPDAA